MEIEALKVLIQTGHVGSEIQVCRQLAHLYNIVYVSNWQAKPDPRCFNWALKIGNDQLLIASAPRYELRRVARRLPDRVLLLLANTENAHHLLWVAVEKENWDLVKSIVEKTGSATTLFEIGKETRNFQTLSVSYRYLDRLFLTQQVADATRQKDYKLLWQLFQLGMEERVEFSLLWQLKWN